MSTFVCICVCVFMSLCLSVHASVCLRVYVCEFVCGHQVNVSVSMYLCVSICVTREACAVKLDLGATMH